MGYQVSLSRCSRYVIYRPHELADTLEQTGARLAALREFAGRHDTRRVLLDWTEVGLPPEHKLYDTMIGSKDSLEHETWRVALLYSRKSPADAIAMVTGFTKVLETLGQQAAAFDNRKKALAWLVADAP